MDAFEDLVAGLLRRQNYWTLMSYKLELPQPSKEALDKPTMPRPEIDILAYKPSKNELLWVECKSYLESGGVTYKSLTESSDRYHIRVFTDQRYRKIVTQQLKKQTVEEGLVLPKPIVKYCLVAGRIVNAANRAKLKALFQRKGWHLWDDQWLKTQLMGLAKLRYENEIAVVVAKLWERTAIELEAS
jgi:hypothetical protein